MNDLVDRLRGEYRIRITDRLGPAGGEEPDNPGFHVRTFETPPIQHEAAKEIERLKQRGDNHAETLRGIAKMNPTTEGDRMRQWAIEGLYGYTEAAETTIKDLTDKLIERDAELARLTALVIQAREALAPFAFAIEPSGVHCSHFETAAEALAAINATSPKETT